MNIKFFRYFIFSLLLAGLVITAWSQQYPCGTTVSQQQKDFELSFSDSVYLVTALNRTYHIAVFITRDNKGQPNMNPAEINAALSELNDAFDRIKINFVVHTINYIDNYHFDEIRMGNNERDMMVQNTVRNVINLYLVSSLYNNAGEQICAYSYFPADSTDAILFAKECLNGKLLIEQIGHFFNLYHTHETIFGNELVSRTECKTTGDRCCDTPADPGLTLKVSPDCQYTGNQKDAEGVYYFLTTANFMSSSPLDCRCYFSDKQYRRMINCIQKVKQHLW